MNRDCIASTFAVDSRRLQGCTIKNEADGDIEVEIHRDPIDGKESVVVISDLAPGQSQHIGVHSAISQGVGIRNPIRSIKVTLPSGQKHEILAPFDGIEGPSRDWLFSVDNIQINSLHKLDEKSQWDADENNQMTSIG